MIIESANQFEEAKKLAEESKQDKSIGSRRKVIRNNMDYLLTVVEERHRNADSVIGQAAGGLDIRYSVKDCYRKFFIDEELPSTRRLDDSPSKEDKNLENFEVAPALGVKDDASRGRFKGPGSLLSSVSEQDYFK